MALWENITESFGGSLVPNLLVGTAVVLVAPIVAPALFAGIRPVAKTVLKGGVYVYDKAREVVAEAGEQMSDIVAESRAEMAVAAAAANRRADGSPSGPTGESPSGD
jgi:Protein of unknown function (DUF5132)